MKLLYVAVPVAAIAWIAMSFLPSHNADEFAARIGSDAGFVCHLALVALTIFGIPYLIYRRLRRR